MSAEPSPTILLLERWHSGDETALHQLLEEELPWFREHVSRRLGPILRQVGDVDDFLQEAMLRVLRSGPRFRVSDRGNFRGLMAVLIENTLRDQVQFHQRGRRDRRVEREVPRDSLLDLDPPRQDVTRPSVAVSKSEEAAWMHLAVECLPPLDGEIVRLRAWQDLPFGEIATAVGLKENATRTRYQRALGKMAKNFVQLRSGALDSVLRNRNAAADDSEEA